MTFYAVLMTNVAEFYVMAAAIGCVQGAIQAMSRSYYGRLIPADRASEFFGFYNMMGKFASVLGPFLMAATAAITGNSRSAILSVAILFVGGAIMLAFATRSTRVARGRRTGTRLAARTLPLLHASGGSDAEPTAAAVVPEVRKGQGDMQIPEAVFRERLRERFYDPAFERASAEIDKVIDIAWRVYSESHKSPRTRAAGEGFADPDDAVVGAVARDARCNRSGAARARRSAARSRACC